MTTQKERIQDEDEGPEVDVDVHGGGSNAVYGLGLIGAWVFYIGRATTNRERAIGFLKGFAWPALLVHDLLQFLNRE